MPETDSGTGRAAVHVFHDHHAGDRRLPAHRGHRRPCPHRAGAGPGARRVAGSAAPGLHPGPRGHAPPVRRHASARTAPAAAARRWRRDRRAVRGRVRVHEPALRRRPRPPRDDPRLVPGRRCGRDDRVYGHRLAARRGLLVAATERGLCKVGIGDDAAASKPTWPASSIRPSCAVTTRRSHRWSWTCSAASTGAARPAACRSTCAAPPSSAAWWRSCAGSRPGRPAPTGRWRPRWVPRGVVGGRVGVRREPGPGRRAVPPCRARRGRRRQLWARTRAQAPPARARGRRGDPPLIRPARRWPPPTVRGRASRRRTRRRGRGRCRSARCRSRRRRWRRARRG